MGNKKGFVKVLKSLLFVFALMICLAQVFTATTDVQAIINNDDVSYFHTLYLGNGSEYKILSVEHQYYGGFSEDSFTDENGAIVDGANTMLVSTKKAVSTKYLDALNWGPDNEVYQYMNNGDFFNEYGITSREQEIMVHATKKVNFAYSAAGLSAIMDMPLNGEKVYVLGVSQISKFQMRGLTDIANTWALSNLKFSPQDIQFQNEIAKYVNVGEGLEAGSAAAFSLNKNEILFASDALHDQKEEVFLTTGFQRIAEYYTSQWKLTIIDSEQYHAPSVDKIYYTDDKVMMNYTATDFDPSGDLYLSAIIVDENNSIKAYAKLDQLTTAKTDQFVITDLTNNITEKFDPTTDTIKVFVEKVSNNNKQSDYSSVAITPPLERIGEIEYDANGGTGTMDSTYIKVTEAKALATNSFVKDHYSFAGWSTTANGAVEYAENATYSQTTAHKQTLYAVWNIDSYNVQFQDYDGTVLKDEVVEYGQSATAPTVDDRYGYDFVGWSESLDNIGSDVVIVAQYQAKEYQVTVNTNEFGTASATPAVDAPYNSTVQLTTTPNVGYAVKSITIDGKTVPATTTAYIMPNHDSVVDIEFARDLDEDGIIDEKDDLYQVNVTVNNALYGKAVANPNTDVLHKDIVALSVTANEGYGIKTITIDGEVVEHNILGFIMPDHDSTIAVVFERDLDKDGIIDSLDDKYTVDVQVNDADFGNAAATPTTDVLHREEVTFVVYPKTGYEVESILIDGVEVAKDTTTYQMPDKNSVVIVNFKASKYTIKFTDYDGSVIKEELLPYKTTITLPANPSRSGYKFTGWSPAVDGVVPAGNTTYVATYEKISTPAPTPTPTPDTNNNQPVVVPTVPTYEVQFVDYNGDVLKTETVEENKAATAPEVPAREGYDFTGWDQDITAITADTVVKAQYSQKAEETKVIDSDEDIANPEYGQVGSTVWSLLSLILTILGVLIALTMAVKALNTKEGRIYKIASIALASILVVLFIMLNDMSLKMAFLDKNTMWFALIFVVVVIVFVYDYKVNNNNNNNLYDSED